MMSVDVTNHVLSAATKEIPKETLPAMKQALSDATKEAPPTRKQPSNFEKKEIYITYKTRWLMLLVVGFLNLSNAMMWITFATVADTTIAYYGISTLELNMLSMVFMIAALPVGFIATWSLDILGLRSSLIVAAWLNGLGGLLRNISTFDIVLRNYGYIVLMAGQVLTAMAQPFIMFAPTKLAALWFPDNRRATANMICCMMNPLGQMTAFIVVPLIVTEPSNIPLALWIVSAPAFLILLITTFGVRHSYPPTPPSASASGTSEPFSAGLKQIICNKNYIVLNLSFGIGLAAFTALATLLEQILCPRGYSDDFAGICGALMLVCGIVMSAITGIYVDRTKQFDEVYKVSFSLAVLAGIGFTQVSRYRDQHVLVAITTALFGGFGLCIYPISMELSVEVTYPVAEATSSGFCIITGQLFSITFILAMQYLAQPLPVEEMNLQTACHVINSTSVTSEFTPQDWTYSNLYIFNVISTIGIVMMVILFKAKYKRLEAEKAILEKHKIASNQEITETSQTTRL